VLSSELLRLIALGLVIGGLGTLAVPGRLVPGYRRLAWLTGLAVGVGGAFGGGILGSVLLGSAFHGTRLALAAVVSLLLVGGWALYLRERQLPR
jgi:hypothetical protein